MTDEAFHHKFGKIGPPHHPHLTEKEHEVIEMWAAHCFQTLLFNLVAPTQNVGLYEEFGLDPNRVIEEMGKLVSDETRREEMKEATNIFRVLVKTLVNAGIITDRTKAFYAVYVDMEELKGEGDKMVATTSPRRASSTSGNQLRRKGPRGPDRGGVAPPIRAKRKGEGRVRAAGPLNARLCANRGPAAVTCKGHGWTGRAAQRPAPPSPYPLPSASPGEACGRNAAFDLPASRGHLSPFSLEARAMADGNITKDQMYGAVAPDDFESMLALDRYGNRVDRLR